MKEVYCTSLDYRGFGVTKDLGKVTFVKNLLPSEKALIKITKKYKNYNEAEVVKLLIKSKDRVSDNLIKENMTLSHISYKKQLIFQEELTKETLSKKIDISKIVYSKEKFYYRNKITYQIKNNPYIKLGIFNKNSHNFSKIDDDLLANKNINKVKDILSNYYKENNITENNLEKVIIKGEKDIMVIFKLKQYKDNVNLYKPLISSGLVKSIYLNNNLIYGNKFIITNINNYKFINYPNSFFQVNSFVIDKLYNLIKENISGNILLDCYSGMSSISIYLSSNFKNIYSFEINKDSIDSANKSIKLNEINNITLVEGDINITIKPYLKLADACIFDPPRAGLKKEFINLINNSNIKNIIYVSCNLKTLKRDLDLLYKYKIKKVVPVKMFPQTVETETVVILYK